MIVYARCMTADHPAPVTSVILLREDIKNQQIGCDQTTAKSAADLNVAEEARDEALQQIIQGEKNLEDEQKKSLEQKQALNELLSEEKAALATEKEERCTLLTERHLTH